MLNLYSEEILGLAKNTKHQRGLADASHNATGDNPLCGDKIKFEIVIKKGVITDIGFNATGCAVSKGSATYIADKIIDLPTTKATLLVEDLLKNLEKNNLWQEVAKNPARTKCVTLPWHTILEALQNNTTAVIKTLKTIRDPELPVNIYDLGLIYNVEVEGEVIKILMTLTTPNCPVADSFPALVQNTIADEFPDKKILVELTFEPPWTSALISPDGKIVLGY